MPGFFRPVSMHPLNFNLKDMAKATFTPNHSHGKDTLVKQAEVKLKTFDPEK